MLPYTQHISSCSPQRCCLPPSSEGDGGWREQALLPFAAVQAMVAAPAQAAGATFTQLVAHTLRRVLGAHTGELLGDAKSSLGDAESSLGEAKSSLGDAKSSLGEAKSSLGDAKSSLGDAESSLGDAESLAGRRYELAG
jgi:hypothetical protein